jgi:hypothetical protein
VSLCLADSVRAQIPVVAYQQTGGGKLCETAAEKIADRKVLILQLIVTTSAVESRITPNILSFYITTFLALALLRVRAIACYTNSKVRHCLSTRDDTSMR